MCRLLWTTYQAGQKFKKMIDIIHAYMTKHLSKLFLLFFPWKTYLPCMKGVCRTQSSVTVVCFSPFSICLWTLHCSESSTLIAITLAPRAALTLQKQEYRENYLALHLWWQLAMHQEPNNAKRLQRYDTFSRSLLMTDSPQDVLSNHAKEICWKSNWKRLTSIHICRIICSENE